MANPLPLILLAALIATALLGYLGGRPDRVRRADNGLATIAVRGPAILRNGMFFETVIDVTPKGSVENLAIAVSDDLWREMTINTLIPAAKSETHADGRARFSFGKVDAGQRFRFKIDGQVNPTLRGTVSGDIVVLDGDRPLIRMPMQTRVKP